jgi:hypothetical protein
MKEEPNDSVKRKTYDSPRLVVISLRPEEAVLGHCKNPSTAGPVASTCTLIGPCQTPGS